MANVLGTLFGNIASAIREKTGETGTMKPAEFPDKIKEIEVGNGEYYQKLAETLMLRNPSIMGTGNVLNLAGFVTSDGRTLGTVNSYSFAGFKTVTGMQFTDVLFFSENAFRDCASLKVIDNTAPAEFACGFLAGSLNDCPAIEALIIRGTTNATVNINHGGTSDFYIYVPDELYDEVISNIDPTYHLPAERYRKLGEWPEVNYWNTYYTVNFYDDGVLINSAKVTYGKSVSHTLKKDGYTFVGWNPSPDRVVGDMECHAVWAPTFAAATWQQVVELSKSGMAARAWAVGDEKDLTLNYADGTSETVTVAIGAVNIQPKYEDDATHVAFILKEPLQTLHKIPVTARVVGAFPTVAQYRGSEAIAYLENDVFDALPSVLQENIVTRRHYQLKETIEMKVWLPTSYDILYTNNFAYETGAGRIGMNNLFPTAESRIMTRRGTSEAVAWWTGDFSFKNAISFGQVFTALGELSKEYESDPNYSSSPRAAIVFGFCI
jgi:hypothetical protein